MHYMQTPKKKAPFPKNKKPPFPEVLLRGSL